MVDVFKGLSRLSWRGIEVPVISRSVSFAHEDVRHKFQFRDNEIVEATGAQNLTFSYTIPFREGIAKGPYKSLFVQTFSAFFVACRDKSAGELVDPILGTFPARCTSFSEETDVNKRDGVDVRVEFIHSPPIEDFEGTFAGVQGLQGIESEAGLLEQELEKVEWTQDDPGQGLVNPIAAINGIGRQIQRQGNKMTAALEDLARQCEDVEETIEILENPRNFDVQNSTRRLRDSAIRMKERAEDPQRSVISVTQAYGRSISQVAADAGMTVEELLSLNPRLARVPFVGPNTVVKIYADSRS